MSNRIVITKKPVRSRPWKVIVLFLGLFAWIYCLNWLSSLPALTITDVSIVGNDKVSTQEILTMIEGDLAGSTWFIDNRNILFPRSRLIYTIQDKYGLLSAKFVREGNTLVLIIVERPPIAYMCPGEELYITSETACSWLAEDGLVYGSTTPMIGRAPTSLPLVFSQRSSTTTQEFTKTIANTISTINKVWSSVSSITLYDRYMDVSTPKGLLHIAYTHELDYIANVLTYMSKSPDKEVLMFEYIDMRHGTTLYFKRLHATSSQEFMPE